MAADELDALLRTPQSAGIGLVRRVVGFLRNLRDNGIAVGLGEARDALRVAGALDLSRPTQLRAALKPLLVQRREEAQRFDTLFDAYWLRRGVKRGGRPAATAPGGGQAQRRPSLGPVPEGVSRLADAVTRVAGDEAGATDGSRKIGRASS